MVEFKYAPMFQLGPDATEYYRLTKDHVSVGEFEGKPILKVDPEALTIRRSALSAQRRSGCKGQAAFLPGHGNGNHSRREGTAGVDRLR